jgi:hypothetical protein
MRWWAAVLSQNFDRLDVALFLKIACVPLHRTIYYEINYRYSCERYFVAQRSYLGPRSKFTAETENGTRSWQNSKFASRSHIDNHVVGSNASTSICLSHAH